MGYYCDTEISELKDALESFAEDAALTAASDAIDNLPNMDEFVDSYAVSDMIDSALADHSCELDTDFIANLIQSWLSGDWCAEGKVLLRECRQGMRTRFDLRCRARWILPSPG